MLLTLSPPLILADADGDAVFVAGMANAIPAASAPVTFDCTVSPVIADTAHDREAARPSHPRKYGPGYWPAGGVDPWPASGYRMTLCSSSAVSQLRPGVRYACLPHAGGPFSIRERASQRRSPALATAPAHHLAALYVGYPARHGDLALNRAAGNRVSLRLRARVTFSRLGDRGVRVPLRRGTLSVRRCGQGTGRCCSPRWGWPPR